jgi:hypothetical protein
VEGGSLTRLESLVDLTTRVCPRLVREKKQRKASDEERRKELRIRLKEG